MYHDVTVCRSIYSNSLFNRSPLSPKHQFDAASGDEINARPCSPVVLIMGPACQLTMHNGRRQEREEPAKEKRERGRDALQRPWSSENRGCVCVERGTAVLELDVGLVMAPRCRPNPKQNSPPQCPVFFSQHDQTQAAMATPQRR